MFGLLRTRPLVAHLHTPLALVERHNSESFRWTLDATLADRLERFAVRREAVVTCPSRLLAQDVMSERWAVDAAPDVVRYPIDLGRWDRLQPPEQSPPRVLAVGRLEGRKGPEVLVEAAALIKDEIPGSRSCLSVVRPSTTASRTAIGSGRRPAASRSVPLHRVRPSRGDGDVVRDVACGRAPEPIQLPVHGARGAAFRSIAVCTDQTGVAELIRGTSAGAIVPVDDANALANAGAQARAVVERACAPDVIAERREACYRETIALWHTRRPGQVVPQPSR